jgi:hypothetical protein
MFLRRNRRQLIILGCGILLIGGIWVFSEYWHGGCAGTKAERAVRTDLQTDPLLTALPRDATLTAESTSFLSCRNAKPDVATARRPPRAILPIAIDMVKEYRLANPMTVVELHDHHLATVGRGKWRLTHTDAASLTYCRTLRSYRMVSVMTLDDDRLTIRTIAWTDGADCRTEVAITR